MVESAANNNQEPIVLREEEEYIFDWVGGDPSTPPVRFSFEVEEPCLVRVTTWQVDGETTPCLYVHVEESDVGPKLYQYRAMRNDVENVVSVAPQDPKFQCSVWHCGVEGHQMRRSAKFGIKVQFLEAKPVKGLRARQKQTVTVEDALYFKYPLANVNNEEIGDEFDKIYLLLRAS